MTMNLRTVGRALRSLDGEAADAVDKAADKIEALEARIAEMDAERDRLWEAFAATCAAAAADPKSFVDWLLDHLDHRAMLLKAFNLKGRPNGQSK